MKKNIRIIAIALSILTTILCLPLNALASDFSEPEHTQETTSYELTEATESVEISQSETEVVSQEISEYYETDTLILEYEETEQNRTRNGNQEEDFGPNDSPTYAQICPISRAYKIIR